MALASRGAADAARQLADALEAACAQGASALPQALASLNCPP